MRLLAVLSAGLAALSVAGTAHAVPLPAAPAATATEAAPLVQQTRGRGVRFHFGGYGYPGFYSGYYPGFYSGPSYYYPRYYAYPRVLYYPRARYRYRSYHYPRVFYRPWWGPRYPW